MHGTHDTVNRILDHKDIKAISFVGSDAAGRYIYERGSASGKRVQVSIPVSIMWQSTFICDRLFQVSCTHSRTFLRQNSIPSFVQAAAAQEMKSRGMAGSRKCGDVQANMGAKNHAVVLPDANPESTVAALTGAAFGAAGQR